MTNEEFLAWVEMSLDPEEMISLLIKEGVLEYEDLIVELEPYLRELREIMFDKDEDREWVD